jgi:hypothetical protein
MFETPLLNLLLPPCTGKDSRLLNIITASTLAQRVKLRLSVNFRAAFIGLNQNPSQPLSDVAPFPFDLIVGGQTLSINPRATAAS